MDFAYSPDQLALRDLARKIIERHSERFQGADAEGWHEPLWGDLAAAGLLGVALPEDAGGSGLGLIELGVLLGEIGRGTAPVPVWASSCLGALVVDRFGSPKLRARVLPGVASGELILSAALIEAGAADPRAPLTRATREASGFRLDGTKICVPAAHLAQGIVVAARTDNGIGLFLLDPATKGVTLEKQRATSGEPRFTLGLTGAVVVEEDVIVPPGSPSAGEALVWMLERAEAGLCAMQVGVARRALAMTASYVSERKQFDRPLATFQAVSQRAADAYVDVEAMELTTAQALWRLAEGLPADQEVAVAKFWAAEGGHRVTAAAQHLHGGMGFDRAYPLYRYTLWSKTIELELGGAHAQLAALGAAIATKGSVCR